MSQEDIEAKRKELDALEKQAREKNRPQEATREEIDEEEGIGYKPEPSLRGGGRSDRGLNLPSSIGGSAGKIFIISLVVSLVVVFGVVVMANAGKFITRSDFDKNWQGMVASINDAKSSMAQSKASLDTAIANIPSTINNAMANTTNQINQQITNITNQVNTANSNVQAHTAKINEAVAKLDVANNNLNVANQKIVALEEAVKQQSNTVATLNTSLTALDTRVKALETPVVPTPSTTIPGVTISVAVTDEGTIQTDNSTLGEVKITLVNSSTRDIEDITLSLYIFFDDCGYTDQAIAAATYGSWSIRERQFDEIEVRGRLANLSAGQTRRVYIDIHSHANNYQSGGRVTYLDTSNSDLDVIDWNYSD